MTEHEKAEDLYQMYYECLWHQDEQSRIQNAKKGALIAVDEIVDAIDWHYYETPNNEIEYWQEVKQEIEKL